MVTNIDGLWFAVNLNTTSPELFLILLVHSILYNMII